MNLTRRECVGGADAAVGAIGKTGYASTDELWWLS